MRAVAAAVGLAGLAGACTHLPNLEAFNGAGAVIRVAQPPLGWGHDAQWVEVQPGGRLVLDYMERGRRVRIQREGCVYEYRMPKVWKWLKDLQAPDYYGQTTRVRLEADMTVSLLPWSNEAASPEAEALHRYGFPISPTAKTCPAPGAGAQAKTSAPWPAAASARL